MFVSTSKSGHAGHVDVATLTSLDAVKHVAPAATVGYTQLFDGPVGCGPPRRGMPHTTSRAENPVYAWHATNQRTATRHATRHAASGRSRATVDWHRYISRTKTALADKPLYAYWSVARSEWDTNTIAPAAKDGYASGVLLGHVA
jgi:hypothetical protein